MSRRPERGLRASPGGPLRGAVTAPGDKSISHRALIFGALARGESRIRGLLEAEDVAATQRCLGALGVSTRALGPDELVLAGLGPRLRAPDGPLDCGNAGTALRLLAGLLAGQPFEALLTGDESLRRRPMARIVEPLRALGATVSGDGGGQRAPLRIRGGSLENRAFDLPLPSAQVAGALLLAGLQGQGRLTLRLPGQPRDHSERLLVAMGAPVARRALGEGLELTLLGPAPLSPLDLRVPGDFSSAFFLIVAATITPGSTLRLQGVGLNPTRTAGLDVLRRMGADIRLISLQDPEGEPWGELEVRAAPLRGVEVRGGEVARLLDEVPALAVAAAMAEGDTRIGDAAELRHKESDRVASTTAMLRALGVEAEAAPDGLWLRGRGCAPFAAARVDAQGDHRIALAALVAGLASAGGVEVADAGWIDTSFPGFPATLARLGAELRATPPAALRPSGAAR